MSVTVNVTSVLIFIDVAFEISFGVLIQICRSNDDIKVKSRQKCLRSSSLRGNLGRTGNYSERSKLPARNK